MRLSNDTQQIFPKFKHYIQVDFPKLLHVPRIVSALKKHGRMSLAEVHQFLAWGSGPQIIGMKNDPPLTNVHFPHALEIEEDYIKTFEEDSPAKSREQRPAVGRTSRGRLVYKVGEMILLRLVRDSAYRSLKTYPDPYAAQHEANSFMLDVYGGIVN